jgi:hypothetical protein
MVDVRRDNNGVEMRVEGEDGAGRGLEGMGGSGWEREIEASKKSDSAAV